MSVSMTMREFSLVALILEGMAGRITGGRLDLS